MNIQLQKVSVSKNGRNILRDISAFFHSETLHCIVGQNGSGKTTLLQAILHLLPFEGQINLTNPPNSSIEMRLLSPKMLAQYVAYLPQNPTISFPVSVSDFVLFGRFPHLGFWENYTKEDREIADLSLSQLNLYSLKDREVQTLSGGEFQKVCLARALTQQSPILLLDEPSAALDPKQKKMLFETLLSLVQNGKTIICVTHDDLFFSDKSVTVWGIKEGNWAFEGKGGEIQAALWESVY